MSGTCVGERYIGERVLHAKRRTGFGVAREAGTIRGFIEPKPGWHRALVHWQEDDTEQYVDVENLEPAVEKPQLELGL